MDEVWEGDRWNFRQREVFADFKELCRWRVENGKPIELFAILVWSIWHQRNKTRMNQACYLTKDLQQSQGVAKNLYMGVPIQRLKSTTMSVIIVWIVYIFRLM